MNFQRESFFSAKPRQPIEIDLFLGNIPNDYNFFQQPKSISKYIADHAIELLDIALNENYIINSKQKNKSRTALLLLSNSPKNVMDELLIDGRFLIKLTNILGQASVNFPYSIIKELASRISMIFTNIIIKTNDKDIILDSIGFLTQIIQFIEDDSVFIFFCLAVSDNKSLKEMQIYLSQINLYQFLLNELPKEKETNLQKERNIYHFMINCLRNPILQNSFQKEEIFQKLFENLEKRKNFVLNSQQKQINYGDIKTDVINRIFEVLSLLVYKNFVFKMKPLLSLSIEIVKNFSETIKKFANSNPIAVNDYYAHFFIRKYHAFALDLIAKIAILNSNLIDSNDQVILIKSIERIIHFFPNSTNIIIAAFSVVKSSLLCKSFAKKMIDSLMPLFISLAQSKARIAAAAAATHFLADMDMTKNSSKMIKDFLIKNDQYMMFYNKSFKNYLEKAYVPYGGPVTVFRNKNIKIIRVKKENIINDPKKCDSISV